MKTSHLAAAFTLAISSLAWGTTHDSSRAWTQGEVRKVDKAAGKITLKHEAIREPQMPPMTMSFGVSQPEMLERVKQGDAVRFKVDKVGSGYTVTSIEPIKK
jgi:Cu(I)/Ag(I) efflux system periplasmic protein CusF